MHVIFPETSSSDDEIIQYSGYQSDGEKLTVSALSRKDRLSPLRKSRTSRRLFPDEPTWSVTKEIKPVTTDMLAQSLSTQERLHSLLDNYVKPSPTLTIEYDSDKNPRTSPFRVKFQPSLPRSRGERVN